MNERVIRINPTTYEVTVNGRDKVEIGNREAADFKPCAKLKRWGEECSLVLSIPTAEKILPTVQDDKILWQGKNYRAEFYQATDGFKFNIILPKKPATNVFPLDFGSDNLNFYYQPPLTEELKIGEMGVVSLTETDAYDKDGKVLSHRPENAVGSYAVYYPAQVKILKTVAEGEKYKTGKAFHWYRPLIYDNAGNQCWGILKVDPKAGIRTVTIPQEFLDNAVYPVTIDDTFGYEPEGAGVTTIEDYLKGGVFTCPLGGTGVSISAWLACSSAAKNTKCAIYDALDPNSNIITNGGTEQKLLPIGWDGKKDYDFLSAPTFEAAGEYTLVIWGASGDGECELKYDFDTGAYRYKAQVYNGWPANVDWTTFTYWPSIYCTYELPPGLENKSANMAAKMVAAGLI